MQSDLVLVYELYPYPSRSISSESDLKRYGLWVADCLGKPVEWFFGKTVLELGCGTGEAACGLALLGATVSAIDLSANSISKAKDLQRRFKIDSVDFSQADLFSFPVSKKFDVVLSLGVLHHTKTPKKGFETAVSHAKTGGLVCVGLYNPIGRLRLRFKRWIVGLLAGSVVEKRISVAKKLFFGGKSSAKGDAYLADKFGQPLESYHFVEEILQWLEEANVELVHSRPKFETHLKWMQFKWFLQKRGAFVVVAGKKKSP